VLPSSPSEHKCLCCGALFRPSKRHPRQQFCPAPDCRKASKEDSQRRWLGRQPDYFRGPVHVERVKAWRKAHPGYSHAKRRKKSKVATEVKALQDLVRHEVPPAEAVATNSQAASSDFSQKDVLAAAADFGLEPTLQDLALLQVPLTAGLIVSLTGVSLQETFIPQIRRLVELGLRVLAPTSTGCGRARAFETSNSA
jgi:hypothetical protein